jgi:hypothetical protein
MSGPTGPKTAQPDSPSAQIGQAIGTALAYEIVASPLSVLVIFLLFRRSRRKQAEGQQRLAAERQMAWEAEQHRQAWIAHQRQLEEAQIAQAWAAQQAAEAAQRQQAEAQLWQAAAAAEAQRRQAAAAAEAQRRHAAAAAEAAQRARLAALTERFGEENASQIMRGSIWSGQTREMLVEALGHPSDIDIKILKTKSKTTYKYVPTGKNRYALRVFLDDGVVVGWEDKR